MNSIDKALQFISKGVIAIPLVILLLTLIFLNPRGNLKQKIFKPQPTPTVAVTVENIDLDGEYVCKNEQLQAYIKKRKLYIKTEDKTYLYRDDCFYSWKDKSLKGEKVCGLGQYISLFENLSAFKILNLDNVISSILPGAEGQSAKIGAVLQSCVETEVKNDRVFAIPKEVLFKNSEKPWLRPTFPSSALE